MTELTLIGRATATRREWVGLAVIAVPCLLYSMDLTVLHLAMPRISADLLPSAAEQLWIVDIYGFMIAGLLLTMGTVGDRIGRRRLLMIGAGAFALTSLMAAFAPTAEALIACRALQGMAGATLAPSTLSLIRNMFLDPRERTFAIGLWVAAFSAGGVLGPVFGGLLLSQFWWGAIFLINVPLMLGLMALAPVLLPEYRDVTAGRLDLVGVAQSIVAVLGVIYGIKSVAESGFSVSAALSVLVGAGVAALFVRRQLGLADPLFDMRLFRRATFTTPLMVNLLGLFTVMGTFFFLSQYLQLVAGMSALEAGLWLAPSGLAFATGSVLAPRLAHHFAHGTVVACGFFVAALGFAVLAFVDHGLIVLFLGMMIFCLGLAPVGALTTDLVISAAPPERAGAASGISETSFELGGALGIAVLGSILAASYRSAMTPQLGDLAQLAPDTLAAARSTLGGAIAAAERLEPEAAGARLATAARSAFVAAFQVTSVIAALSAFAAGLIAAARLRGVRAEQHP